MSPPRRPPLPPVVLGPEDRQRIREEVCEEMRRYAPSVPPPPGLEDDREALRDRLETPTGRFRLDAIEAKVREQERQAAADKLAEARETIAELRRQLERQQEQQERKQERAEDRQDRTADRRGDRRWELWMLAPAALVGGLTAKLIDWLFRH